MADNVVVTAGSGTTIAADELTDGTLGTVKVQYVKLMDGTIDGSTKAAVGANGLKVDGSAVTQPVSGSGSFNVVGTTTDGSTTETPILIVGGETNDATAQYQPIPLTAAGVAVKVDGSAVMQPVSGTVTANAGSGTFTVSGTVTANAGTNLNTSALALDASVTGLEVAQASTTSGQKGILDLGAVTTAAPSYTTAQTSPLSLNTSGGLRVDGSGVTQPVSGTVTTTPPSNASTNVTQFGGTNVSTGTGASGAGIPRVTIANDSSLAANQSVNVNQFGGSAVVTGTGISGAGVPRTTVSSDSSLTANQGTAGAGTAGWPTISGNLAQVNATWTSATALNTTLSLAVTNYNTVALAATLSGTLTGGTLVFEGSYDSGTTWLQMQVAAIHGTTATLDSFGFAGQISTAWQVGVGGLTNFRLRLNPAITGTGSVTVYLSASAFPLYTATTHAQLQDNQGNVVLTVGGNALKVGITGNAAVALDAAQNAAAPANELVVGGVYQTTIPSLTAANASQLQVDSTGSLYVNNEGRKQTYSVGMVGFTPIASSTAPTFSVTGSATKTIRITRIGFSSTAATGGVANVIIRRFSALSGGTSASQAANIAKWDTNNATATAVVNTWSVAATTATSAGILSAITYEIVTTAVTVLPQVIDLSTGANNGSLVVLRGTSDFLGFCISSVATTPIANAWIEWTEE
jgi:hypothetical protein